MNGYLICFNEWALDKSIKTELGLLLIIASLSDKNGYALASNSYLSQLFDVDEVTISRRLSKLKKKGYITMKYKKDGAKVTERKIYVVRLTKINK